MEWNREDNQGKSKEQVEFSYRMSSIAWAILIVVTLSIMLFGCKSSEKIDCDAYSMVEHSK